MNKYKKIDFNTNDLNSLSANDIKKAADHWFRKYLLSKAKRNSFDKIYCPLKKRWYSEDMMHVCHYIDRVKTILRYDETNCILCCKESNTIDAQTNVEGYRSLHHKDFEEFLGEEDLAYLLTQAKKVIQTNKQSYIRFIENLKTEINE